MANVTTVIHIHKKKWDQRGKSKFSRVNITRPEMGKQNIQYMYMDQRGKSKFSRVNITRPEMGKQNIQYMYKLQRSDNKKM